MTTPIIPSVRRSCDDIPKSKVSLDNYFANNMGSLPFLTTKFISKELIGNKLLICCEFLRCILSYNTALFFSP